MEARAAELNQLAELGRKLRDAGRWTEAIACYSAANEIDGSRYDIKHNLALSLIAANRTQEANRYLAHAIALKPDLWPSHILKARMLKEKGEIEAADDVLMHVLKHDRQNGHALLAAADLDMNEFGDAMGARERVVPLLKDPTFRGEAELTSLMSKLYDRDESDEELSYMLMDFAKRELNMPTFKYSPEALQGRTGYARRKRVGLLSPMFCVSPVYFLTISTFRQISKEYDLVVFNRGSRQDWGTLAFRDIAVEWYDVQHIGAPALANTIKSQSLDVLFDLGGWSDPIGLRALSAKPAPKMFKWVGGQSATTGLDTFDGFLTDEFQSPAGADRLHSERLVRITGGYVDYTPPPYMPARKDPKPTHGIAAIGNPAKMSSHFFQMLKEKGQPTRFIDRRFAYKKAQKRIINFLGRECEFIAPGDHAHYLEILSQQEVIIDTVPYSCGLTAVEACSLGVRINISRDGYLFSSRHAAAHVANNTRKSHLKTQINKLIEQN